MKERAARQVNRKKNAQSSNDFRWRQRLMNAVRPTDIGMEPFCTIELLGWLRIVQ
jgi:hypothetical protein